jgi:exodeoxyribonuclease VII large subunit
MTVTVNESDGTPTLSVSELAEVINQALRVGLGGGVWVRGEVQGWNGRGNHAYFRLVEDGPDGKASIDVAWFAGHRTRLRPLLAQAGLEFGDGLKVRIFGNVDFYAPNGRISLKMSNVDPRYTLGELALERDALVRRLREQGLYDANRRHLVPPVPLRVGVITSVGSAAWHDFTAEIERSALGFRLVAVDARVQGDEAPAMVAAALDQLGGRGDLDVLVVIRGGGSKTDLAAFDSETVARAIAACELPVFTGIGHEIDVSVADEVANRSFKTPTAVAGALIERVMTWVQATETTWTAIAHRCSTALQKAETRLNARAEELGRRPQRALDAAERHIGALEAQVRALDPVRVMARGWSITRGPDGTVLRDIAHLQPGDVVSTTIASGAFTSRVEEIS